MAWKGTSCRQRTPGGQRVRETLEFYRFMRAELPESLERWQQHRRALLSDESWSSAIGE